MYRIGKFCFGKRTLIVAKESKLLRNWNNVKHRLPADYQSNNQLENPPAKAPITKLSGEVSYFFVSPSVRQPTLTH